MDKILNFMRKYDVYILVILGLLLYFPALFFEFISDDNTLLLQNQYLNGRVDVNFFDFFVPKFVREDIYIPFTFIIFWLIIKIFGISSFALHFVNVMFYVLSSIALYSLLKKIINNNSISFFAVILYIIHPCHIENTAWISSMGYNIASLFFFLSFISFILAFDTKKNLNYVYSVIFYILAILSQPIAVILPAILILWVYCFRKEKLKESIVPILSYLPFLFIYLYLFHKTTSNTDRFREQINCNILDKCNILGFDIFNSFIPINLSPIQSIPNLFFIVPLFVFILLFIYFRKNKVFLFIGIFEIISILPYSNIFFYTKFPLAVRYLIFSSISSCIFISYLSFYLLEKFKEKNIKYISFIFFLALYFFFFIFYLTVYKNNDTLWAYSYKININNNDISAVYSKIYYSKSLIEKGKYDEALIVLNKIPENDSNFYCMGMKIVLLMNINRIDEALELSNKMQKMFPNEFKTYLYLFDINMLLKNYDEAFKYINIAEEKCRLANLYKNNNLLILIAKKIKLDYTLAKPDDFIESLKIISNNFVLLQDNGEFSTILEKRDYKSREEICLNCLKKYNNHYSQSLIFLLSCLYMRETYKNDASEVMKLLLNDIDKAREFVNKGDTNSAEKLYLSVISKNKYMYQAYYNLGLLYLQMNKRESAKDVFNKMLEINPNDEQIKKIYNSL